MFNSRQYWETRYQQKQTSGAGSYHHLAVFKANVINEFLEKHAISFVIDYGMGDGNQLKLLNLKNVKYTGIDVSKTIIEKCKTMFGNDPLKNFILDMEIQTTTQADVVMSCDVLYHLIEDNVYEKYMDNLFTMAKRYVIIYARDEDLSHTAHVKFRKFTTFIQERFLNWVLIQHIPNRYPQKVVGKNNDATSPSDFYIYEKRSGQQSSIPLYVSCTSIFKNQHLLVQTLQSLLQQTRLATKIFVYLSQEPYLLDQGFSEKKISHRPLCELIEKNSSMICIEWVENDGSYRKLLPLLKQKWKEDCYLATVDDDTIYHPHLLENMVRDCKTHQCVVNYRGFTPQMKTITDFDYLKRAKLVKKHLYNFATGKGCILYKPQFFHKTGQLIFQKDIYKKESPCQDDVWFYLIRILNNVPCFIDTKPYMSKDLHNSGLFSTYNSKHNQNTKVCRQLVSRLFPSCTENTKRKEIIQPKNNVKSSLPKSTTTTMPPRLQKYLTSRSRT